MPGEDTHFGVRLRQCRNRGDMGTQSRMRMDIVTSRIVEKLLVSDAIERIRIIPGHDIAGLIP